MNHRPLCVAPRCRSLGYHLPDCTDVECRGCQPRLAADGLNLCYVHTRDISTDAQRAAEVYVELALVLSNSGAPGEKTSGSKEVGAALNERAVEARTTIRHTLVSWCRLVSEERGITLPWKWDMQLLPEGFIGPPNRVRVPDDSIVAIAGYVSRHSEWLSAHPAAGEVSDELHELAHGKPWRTAYPSGARVVVVGACPQVIDEQPCGNVVRAILRRTDALLPSELVCDNEQPHKWTADQWRGLARHLRPDSTRSYTSAEIAQEWRLPLGSVYRLASEHRWRRTTDGRKPVLYSAADVEVTMRERVA